MKTIAIIFISIVTICVACRDVQDKAKVQDKKATPNAAEPVAATGEKPIIIKQDELLHPGGQYCIIKKIRPEEGVIYLDADYIQFFTGDDAVKEAKKRGDAEKIINDKGDTVYAVLDDVYIVNDNKMIRRLPLESNVEILLLHTGGGRPAWVRADVNQLRERISDNGIFILTIENGVVTRIRQQYLP